ncbi:MAG: TonB-dependent receptor [Bacteroidota bacterium]
MNYKALFTLFLLIVGGVTVQAQNRITGTVKSGRTPVVYAAVRVVETNSGAYTDEKGMFTIDSLLPGTYTLEVSLLGYEKVTLRTSVPGNPVAVALSVNAREIAEVNIEEKSTSTRINESPLAVRSLDVKPLYARSSNVLDLINQTAGIKVQQDGGLGSFTNVKINGLGGKRVKYFIDGIPLDYQGFGLSQGINNIPVNLIDRIEIYKGATPVNLGSDALGGAINIVTNSRLGSYVDVSTERSSFNTWRTTMAGRYTHARSGFFIRMNGYHNYSDNTYNVRAAVANEFGNPDTVKVRRFHDRFRSYAYTLEAGVKGKRLYDKFQVSAMTTESDKQIQQPLSGDNLNKVYGAALLREDGQRYTVQYRQDSVFDKPMDIKFYAAYNKFNTYFIDTATSIYNWYGEVVASKRPGGELGFFPFNSRITTVSRQVQLNWTYHLTPQHKIDINILEVIADRNGEDTTAKAVYVVDPFANPQHLNKTYAGISYQSSFFNDRVVNIISGKYNEMSGFANNALMFLSANKPLSSAFRGWNNMLRITPIKDMLILKASFEHAARLPDEYELFGDGFFVRANPDLLPETSKNLNAGFRFMLNRSWLKADVEVNYTRRQIINNIFLAVSPNSAQYQNLGAALIRGWEYQLRIYPLKWMQLDYTLTSLDWRNRTDITKPNANVDPRYYDKPVPREPLYTYSAGVTLNRHNLFKQDERIELYWQSFYTRMFYRFFVEDGLEEAKDKIPTQYTQNLGISYTLSQNRASLSVEVHNLADKDLFDNFGLQKPGRSYHVKLRWFIWFTSN